ncbi:acetyltransferase [Methylomonas sp. AM2-LC]|uniref:acetyltransferase n=1 Tax=Methylomonas sp. AM2-LC TaxID=3153301 RepID=UPI0032663182
MKPVIILGSGGHARVILNILSRLGVMVKGFVDPHRPVSSIYMGISVLGDDQSVLNCETDQVELVNGIGSLPRDAKLRSTLFDFFQKRGYTFKTVIDPLAFVADDVRLAAGVQVMAGVIIQTGTIIAENSIVNSGVIVEHDCRIGKHVHIAPGAVLSGEILVGDHVHIGTGATVIQGIEIGEGSVIGAGSVVTRSVSCQQIVFPPRAQHQDL